MTSAQALPAPTNMVPTARVRRWPALAAATYIGIFCLVAGGAVVWSLANGTSLGEDGVVILAISLRLVTVALALASIMAWGNRVPGWIVLAGLWGAAAVQLLYPLAETVVKLLILTGVMEPLNKGISDLSAEGWFNFGATWLVWGIPGVLFALAALSYGARRAVNDWWVLFGVVGGGVLLLGLGLVIG